MESREDFAARFGIAVPQIYHNVLPRRNVADIIDKASMNMAVCIVAPYGCGKTLSVISWLREGGRKAAWLDLGRDDESDAALAASLTAAVLSFSGEPDCQYDFSADPAYLNDPWAFLREAVLKTVRNGRKKILVIDNFHFIHDAGLLRVMRDFIYTLLGTWRVIIISRAELPPFFNDLMLKGHICLITLNDLSFSAEETAEYFSMNGYGVDPRDVLRMRNDTEGWPAALNVVLTVSRGGPIGYGEAARAYVMGFFDTEIWENLNEATKDFLLKTSVLDRLTPSLCHAVTGIGATLPILNWLYFNGLFISALDERDTYCYHRVFRDFLRDKLSSSGIDGRELYMKVAWWLFERDEIIQSFPYFFKAGDLYGVNRVLKILDPADMGTESFLELTECITELNIEELKPYPVIVSRMAMIHFLKGNIAEMRALSKIFMEWIDPGALPILPEEYAELVWDASWLIFLDPDEDVPNDRHDELTHYKEYVPYLNRLHLNRAAVFGFPSILMGMRNYTEVVPLIEPFLESVKKTGLSAIGDEFSWLQLDLMMAEHYYETENFPKAEEIIRRVFTIAEDRQIIHLCFICTALLVKLMRAVHNTREIDALASRLETTIMDGRQYCLLPNFHAFELRNRLAEGQTGLTGVFEQENEKNRYKPYFFLLYRHVTLVRGLMSTGDYNEALLILGNLELLCQKYKRVMDLIEVNVLKAAALYALGYEEDSCSCLAGALNDAKRYGFIRVFSDDAKALWPILDIVRKRMPGQYVKNIVISCKKELTYAGYKLAEKNYSHLELTKAEVRILRNLQAGMSYTEIAQDNSIQISTVKSRVHNIYSKLGVNNKTSAVIEAKNLGIL